MIPLELISAANHIQRLTKSKTHEDLVKLLQDPRLYVVRVDPEIAGPFYNHSRARNIGAQVAKHNYLLFLDADCFTDSFTIARIKELFEEESVEVVTAFNPSDKNVNQRELPDSWTVDGQIAMSFRPFCLVNGFNETHSHWGGETYDIFMRICQWNRLDKKKDKDILCVEGLKSPFKFSHQDHDDDLRTRYSPTDFIGTTKSDVYCKSCEYLKSKRSISVRAQPGDRYGISQASEGVVVVHPATRGISILNPEMV